DGQTQKNGISHPHEEYENEQHKDKTEDYRIHEVVNISTGLYGLVCGDFYIQSFREMIGLIFGDNFLNFIRSIDQVFTRTFDDVKRNNRFSIQSSKILLFLETV